jgi:2-methylcitrate dehydratase PrpD
MKVRTLVEAVAAFVQDTRYEELPPVVIEETKKIILDSLGCGLAAVDTPNGRIGIDYGRKLGGAATEATIIGVREKSSIFGASFANGELINALDYDGVLPPGHVTPYVLPVALALAEMDEASGQHFIVAMAVAHELTYRFGKAMDYLRDITGSEVRLPSVYGYSSAIFGAVAGLAKLRPGGVEIAANALGMAAAISPVNSQAAWFEQAPVSTVKYTMPGVVVQSALTAYFMAKMGHRGNIGILDDRDHGYPRFIGTKRWQPERLVEGLGNVWGFPPAQSYKPYPHCRIFHGLLDGLREIIEEHGITPNEIDKIKAWGEGFVTKPVWLNQQIETPVDAQFSVSHGLAVAAHGIPPGRRWQDPDVICCPSIIALMKKVEFSPHPDYAKLIAKYPACRPARVVVFARGREYETEHLYPKGSNAGGAKSALSVEELTTKFADNASGVLSEENIDIAVEKILSLEGQERVNDLMALMAP